MDCRQISLEEAVEYRGIDLDSHLNGGIISRYYLKRWHGCQFALIIIVLQMIIYPSSQHMERGTSKEIRYCAYLSIRASTIVTQ